MANLSRRTVREIIHREHVRDYLASEGVKIIEKEPPRAIKGKEPLPEPPAPGARKEPPQVTDTMITTHTKAVVANTNDQNARYIDSVLRNRNSAILVVIRNKAIVTSTHRDRAALNDAVEKFKKELRTDEEVVILDNRQEGVYRETLTGPRLDELCNQIVSFAESKNVEGYIAFLIDNIEIVVHKERLLQIIDARISDFFAAATDRQLAISMTINRPGEEKTGKVINDLIVSINRKLRDEGDAKMRNAKELVVATEQNRAATLKFGIVAILVAILVALGVLGYQRQRGSTGQENPRPSVTATQEETPTPEETALASPSPTPSPRPKKQATPEPAATASTEASANINWNVERDPAKREDARNIWNLLQMSEKPNAVRLRQKIAGLSNDQERISLILREGRQVIKPRHHKRK